MSDDDLEGLSADDRAILFESNPYSYYNNTGTDASPFIQVMREEEERFFAAFPEARIATEYRRRRKADILAYLAARRAERSSYNSGYTPQGDHYTSVPGPSNLLAAEEPAYNTSYINAPHDHTSLPQQFTSSYEANHTYDTTPVPVPVPEHVPARPSSYQMQSGLDPPFPLQSLHRVDERQSQTIELTRPAHPEPDRQDRRRSNDQDAESQLSSHASTSDRGDRRSRSRASSSPGPSTHSGPSPRPNKQQSNASNNKKSSGSKRRTSSVGTRAGPTQPGKRQQGYRLACLFCRGRKIACGAPLPGSATCNQCHRRSLPCEFPSESRRGMRKTKVQKGSDEGVSDDQTSSP